MDLSNWRLDFAAEKHQQEKALSKEALTRLAKDAVERRVSSSSFSSQVHVTDCCWVPTTSSTSTFVLCGLSNGCVCLLNANNLSKIYLFEGDQSEPRPSSAPAQAASPSGSGGSSRRAAAPQQVSVDCSFPAGQPAAANSGGLAVVCLSQDGAVRSCVLDTTSAVELKKLQSSEADVTLAFPVVDKGLTLTDTFVRFSPSGTLALALLSYTEADETVGVVAQFHYRVAVLEQVARQSGGSGAASMRARHTWASISTGERRARDATAACLRYMGWWDSESVLCVWSTGVVQLLRLTKDGLSHVTEVAALDGPADGAAVSLACATAALPVRETSTATGTDPAGVDIREGMLAVTFGSNVITTFNITVWRREAPASKRARLDTGAAAHEDGDAVGRSEAVRMRLSVTQQSYFTEDLSVRSVALMHAFSWVVAATLESGAVIFLDAETMELLVHRPLKRLTSDSEDDAEVAAAAVGSVPAHAASKRLRCFATHRPLNFAVAEHNTVTLLKPQ